ncbi:hypothetical protein B0G77_6951 [Paraburkholderia sp. BL10I2N1]|nr:hypothetical protein B0G77_6951 [Paraburkholderia sp. BL10I2N1]
MALESRNPQAHRVPPQRALSSEELLAVLAKWRDKSKVSSIARR